MIFIPHHNVRVNLSWIRDDKSLAPYRHAQRLLRRGVAEVQGVVHDDHIPSGHKETLMLAIRQKGAEAVAPTVLQDQGKESEHTGLTSLRIFDATFQGVWPGRYLPGNE
jgi:hypothetical protein